MLKYKELHHQAKHIDRLIDANIGTKSSLFIRKEMLIPLILGRFSDFYVESSGWHKVVFGNRSLNHRVVLKVGPKKSIENDHRAYKRVPHSVRHRLFAKIFWHTKYCLLQEYGSSVKVTPEQLDCFRRAVNKYGIFDVKAENIRTINGELKIIDANSTRILAPTLLRKVDQLKHRLPKKLNLLIKKFTRRLHEG